jgi:hypothetical protein
MKNYWYLLFLLIFIAQPASARTVSPHFDSLETSIVSVHNEAEFQSAIASVPDGGIIEMSTKTYFAPTGGFDLSNLSKRFIIRPASGATVTFHGNGHEIMKITNDNYSANKGVIFQDLTFSSGQSSQGHIAGGITLHRANSTFIRCTFDGNTNTSTAAGGGGVVVNWSSIVFFFDSTWSNNTAKSFGAGMAVEGGSKVYIHNSRFVQNRTNIPNHSVLSHGGGIMVIDSTVRVSNTLFDNNQAGYAAGALYVLGTWRTPLSTPSSDVIIANSTFTNNVARRDPSVSSSNPTEGGAIHAEDQTTLRIYNSRFIRNSADIGGGVNLYRSIVEVEGGVFIGNRAEGIGQARGFGGAVNVSSNDTSADGSTNRRSATFSITNSWIQGENIVALSSGGIAASGDGNRVYGTNGVSQRGTLSENMANVAVSEVVFADLDVQYSSNSTGSGNGGALVAALTNLSVSNCLVILSDAKGQTYSSGGGFSILDQSVATISNSTFGKNTSDLFGGALFVQGANITVDGSFFTKNELSPGTQEPLLQSYGAAIFSSPESSKSLYIVGTIQNTIFSENVGLPFWDQDNSTGPINDLRYNSNLVYSTGYSGSIYCDTIPGYCGFDVNNLNATIINRPGTDTDKSQIANVALSTSPVLGDLKAGPPVLTTAAPGDTLPTPGYLAYSWSGGTARLDGSTISGFAGMTSPATLGTHTLSVSGVPYQATIWQAARPAAHISSSGAASPYTLSWSVSSGTFLDGAINQGVAIPSEASGNTSVNSPPGAVYMYYAITKEGGVIASTTVGQTQQEHPVYMPMLNR